MEVQSTEAMIDRDQLKDALGQQKIVLDALRSGTYPAASISVAGMAIDLTRNMVAVIEKQLSDIKPKKKSGAKKKKAKKK